MYKLAITGLIGSGKSSVCKIFQEKYDFVAIYSDEIVKNLQRPGEDAYHQIIKTWGSDILDSDNKIIRKKLAEIVFKDNTELKKLEKILHPKVRKKVIKKFELYSESNVVIELPLLKKGDPYIHLVDHVILVDTSIDILATRLHQNRKMTKTMIEERLKSQPNLVDRKEIADYIIKNNGDSKDLEAEVAKCWHWLQTV